MVDHRLEHVLRDDSFQQFVRLKNPGSYPDYEPCNECGFAGTYCDPCWINCYLGLAANRDLCLRVGGMLDDMKVEWRKRDEGVAAPQRPVRGSRASAASGGRI